MSSVPCGMTKKLFDRWSICSEGGAYFLVAVRRDKTFLCIIRSAKDGQRTFTRSGENSF